MKVPQNRWERDVLDGVRVSQRSIDDRQLSELLTHPVVFLVRDVDCVVDDLLYLHRSKTHSSHINTIINRSRLSTQAVWWCFNVWFQLAMSCAQHQSVLQPCIEVDILPHHCPTPTMAVPCNSDPCHCRTPAIMAPATSPHAKSV